MASLLWIGIRRVKGGPQFRLSSMRRDSWYGRTDSWLGMINSCQSEHCFDRTERFTNPSWLHVSLRFPSRTQNWIVCYSPASFFYFYKTPITLLLLLYLEFRIALSVVRSLRNADFYLSTTSPASKQAPSQPSYHSPIFSSIYYSPPRTRP